MPTTTLSLVKLLPRRRKDEPAVDTAPEDAAAPGTGKGRPTPKRRDVAPGRRGPVAPPPMTRREAYRRMREKNSTRRQAAREQVRGGGGGGSGERQLPARDRGPERALVRDIVDSRRNIGSIFLFVAVLVFVGYLLPSSAARAWAVSLWMAVFLMIIVDSFVLARRIKSIARERFPEAKPRGLTWYGIQRSTMIRRWRLPKARVKVGDKI